DARRQLAAKHKETAELREKIEAAAGAHAAYRALNKCGETQIGTAELELPACFVNFKVPYTAKVREPSQCVYEATMTHPAACDAQVLTQGDRVLTPHEAHLEL
ncbi:unnamed protein product, partial [Effrenium voratum]